MSSKVHEAIKGVWEEHEDTDWREDQSHYRGVGRWADDALWQNIGRGSVKKLSLLARYLGRDLPANSNVLEWGPGGGSNLHGFRNIAKTYVGVDISQKNLNEAKRMIEAEPDSSVTFQPVLLDGDPETVIGRTPEIDVFLSTACFQHFPSKPYGVQVLKAIRACCTDRAFGLIQIRFDNGNPKYKGIDAIEDYKEHHIRANSYALEEFWSHAMDQGFLPAYVANINPKNNYATFYLTSK